MQACCRPWAHCEQLFSCFFLSFSAVVFVASFIVKCTKNILLCSKEDLWVLLIKSLLNVFLSLWKRLHNAACGFGANQWRFWKRDGTTYFQATAHVRWPCCVVNCQTTPLLQLQLLAFYILFIFTTFVVSCNFTISIVISSKLQSWDASLRSFSTLEGIINQGHPLWREYNLRWAN